MGGILNSQGHFEKGFRDHCSGRKALRRDPAQVKANLIHDFADLQFRIFIKLERFRYLTKVQY